MDLAGEPKGRSIGDSRREPRIGEFGTGAPEGRGADAVKVAKLLGIDHAGKPTKSCSGKRRQHRGVFSRPQGLTACCKCLDYQHEVTIGKAGWNLVADI